MKMAEILDGLSCVSLRTLSLALRRPSGLRPYIADCLKKYDELAGNGLSRRGFPAPAPDLTITIPAAHTSGGMTFGELVILARVTKSLTPRTIFEIGTYNGLSTAVFMLNSDPNARVVTLDLPLHAAEGAAGTGNRRAAPGRSSGYVRSDEELVASRRIGSVPEALGLHRYTQLLCDSLDFDPAPYVNSVDLGLVDGAHDTTHVHNDTIKMARMASDHAIVFWHDYGGKGAFRPLASYLERLGKRCPLYTVPDTSLAWAVGRDLKRGRL